MTKPLRAPTLEDLFEAADITDRPVLMDYARRIMAAERLDEARYHLQFYKRPQMYDFAHLYKEQLDRIVELETKVKGDE